MSETDILFFKCWRNKYIKTVINKFVRKFQNIYNFTKSLKITTNILYNSIPHKNYIQYLNFSNNFVLDISNLPFYLKELELPENFNSELKTEFSGLVHLKTLKLGGKFNNDSINKENVLPIGLEQLSLGDNFSQPLKIKRLSNLKVLNLSKDWNLPLNSNNFQIPDSIERLEFGAFFNQKIDHQLPSNLKALILNHIFNREIEALPIGLKELLFGNHFNQEIRIGLLPNTLEYLKFGNDFSKPLPIGTINQGLLTIIFGQCFNQPLEIGSLPNTLKYCHFSKNYNQKLAKGVLPDSLLKVVFNLDHSIDNIFENETLPKSLDSIVFGHEFNVEFTSLDFFPPNIKSLHIPHHYNKKFTANSFPSTIEKLFLHSLKHCFSNDLIGIFKNGLKELTIVKFDKNENPYIKGMFPEGLQILNINSPIYQGLLPNSLKELVLSSTNQTDLTVGNLPQSLKKLEINTYVKNLTIGSLPDSIEELIIGELVSSQSISRQLLPKSLRKLTLQKKILTKIDEYSFPENLESLILENLNQLNNLDLTKMKSLVQLKILNDPIFMSDTQTIPSIKLPPCLVYFKYVSLFSNNYTFNSQNPESDSIENRNLSIDSIFNYDQENVNNNNNISLKKLIWDSNILLLKGDIPPTVEYLRLGKNYESCRFISEGCIPSSVKTLVFKGFSPSSLKIPSSITNLSLLSTSDLYTIDSKNSIETLNLSYTTYINPTIPKNLDISKVKLNFSFYDMPSDDYW
ncbi:hypothetical protein ACTA71_006264 [Dictyostelium dimigraforme]